jgi:pimeloyl-ACP methyl ester carboxylesterase
MTDPSIDVHPDDLVPRHDVPLDGRSGFVMVEHRQVHYLEWGSSAAPPVLCLHGGGQTAYMYEELGSALRADHHVLAPDLPNHGDSDPLLDNLWGREHLAATIPPLLDEFGLQRVVLVGASLGGLTSISLAAEHPERIGAIVLIDIGHRLEDEGVKKIMDFMNAHESFGSLEEAAEFISSYLPYRKSFRPENLKRNLRQRADGRWIWKHGMGRRWQRQFEQTGSDEFDWKGIMTGVEEDAAGIDVPVLLLRGGASDVLSGDAAEELMTILKHGRLETVEKAGHLAAGDNPHSTVNLVKTFLVEVGW